MVMAAARAGDVYVLGVRHHSPACARLVSSTIRALRPAHVLIEGPADLNGRFDELLLGHELPVALYSFLRTEGGMRRAVWYPFCAYSPEWVAIQAGHEVGAEVRFMDLPAWHDAFSDIENRASDRADRYCEAVDLLCERTGAIGHDALWDHLFEGETDDVVLSAALERYFVEIRLLSALSGRDAAREEYMRSFIDVAKARGGTTVVVCGGFHAPALTGLEGATGENHDNGGDQGNGEPGAVNTDWPEVPTPEAGQAETYLVPYSYGRLDAFHGYGSGMPSPAYYEELARNGPSGAADAYLQRTAATLRSRGLAVSTADLVAARTQTEALARLRGHRQPLRVDLLDGLATALLKDSLDQPFPWDHRAPLHPRTHPVLAAIVQTFTGERAGRLHPKTPRPPLLADARAEMARVGVVLGPPDKPRERQLDLTTNADSEASGVLHRLRTLDVPGIGCLTNGFGVREAWTLARSLDADVALIEASIHGPTLESAAAGRLQGDIVAALAGSSSSAVGTVLVQVVRCRLEALGPEVVTAAASAIESDSQIDQVGSMLETLSSLIAVHEVFSSHGSSARLRQDIAELVEPCLRRFLWLLEQVVGAAGPADRGVVRGLVALIGAARRTTLDESLIAGVLLRTARERAAPPSVRGACLGALWTLGLGAVGLIDSLAAFRSLAPDEEPGDFLGGLFATARRLATTDDELIRAIDELVDTWTADDFLRLLPGLRNAFRWFPPRERAALAGRIAALRGLAPGTRLIGRMGADEFASAQGAQLDEQVEAVLVRYGLSVTR